MSEKLPNRANCPPHYSACIFFSLDENLSIILECLLGQFIGKEPLCLKQVGHFTGKYNFIGNGMTYL